MKKILLDTNFLLIPYRFNVDIFSEIERICHFAYELCVLDRTIDELKNIVEKQGGKHKQAAKAALQLIKIKRMKIIRIGSSKRADDLIEDYSAKKGCIVATQDKDLKRKLINHGIEVIVLRQKKFLAMANDKGL